MKASNNKPPIIAVLGGGQLGTMLATAAQPLRISVHCLDPDPQAPAAYNAQSFAEGEFTDSRTVEAFGKHASVATVEIEAVSVAGLTALRDVHGVPTHPSPEALALIQDKGAQKQFYEQRGFATAPFTLYENAEAIRTAVESGSLDLPFVQKLRRGGYDGRGVQVVKTTQHLDDLLPGPSVVEALAPIAKELAVVAARNPSGEVATFPVVEMDFDPNTNLVTQLLCPARISSASSASAKTLAERLIAEMDVCGLLAVEFFLLDSGELWINEVAPRPHNSGHITMNGFATSQFEQHLRAVLDYPLGSTQQYRPAAMINLLGAENHTGPAEYEGLQEVLGWPGVAVHLYGKATTRPARKMGHVNCVADTLEEATALAARVRSTLRVISAPRNSA